MIVKLNSGIVGKGFVLEAGDVVDWKNEADCERFIERGLATKATAEEIKTAAGKVRSYTPPAKRPEDKWPPASLKKLKSGSDNDAA